MKHIILPNNKSLENQHVAWGYQVRKGLQFLEHLSWIWIVSSAFE